PTLLFLRYNFLMSTILLLGACNAPSSTADEDESDAPAAVQDSFTQLVWADEFDGSGPLDSTKWAYDIGGHGWGNQELQYYTDRLENARREDGHLLIEARQESFEGSTYTSARLVTRDRQTWQRGRVAVRAKLPTGLGTWPAIWMLGQNIKEVGWPTCGEIDIMEHLGFSQDTVYGTVHTDAFNHIKGTERSGHVHIAGASDDFHTYHIDWHDDHIDFGVDDEVYFTFNKVENATDAEWPYDKPHYLLLNIAVGGSWGGSRGVDSIIWPQRMVVDWVRVSEAADE
ncbi:MAG: glycoside hydrolase family 16 protein, partial [Bacteroidota bacterium]